MSCETIQNLRQRIETELGVEKSTKRSALRLALVGAIRDGVFVENQRLPTEIDLAAAVGLSLGTVQAALGQLQDLGLIVRRRGDGTRVAGSGQISPSIWHFRFRLLATGEPVKLLEQNLEILTTAEAGPWSDHLGVLDSYLVLRRRLIAQDGLRLGAEMYLDSNLVPPGQISARELRSTNLRALLEARLGIRSSHVSHEAVLVTLDEAEASKYGMIAAEPCFRLDARTFAGTGQPFYYQHIFAPARDFSLSF